MSRVGLYLLLVRFLPPYVLSLCELCEPVKLLVRFSPLYALSLCEPCGPVSVACKIFVSIRPESVCVCTSCL
jgi:hypothetical protein